MKKTQSFAYDKWIEATGNLTEIYSPISGELIFGAGSDNVDFKKMFEYARAFGYKNLQKYTFHDRARMLKKIALYLLKNKEELYRLSYQTGATRLDSWIDIEGGCGNLFIYSGKGRRELSDNNIIVDGDMEPLSKEGNFVGQHVYVPMQGVSLHINAFNFPVWGMLEKMAVNILAGIPCIVKPATITCYLTEAVVRLINQSEILPQSALQLICGSAHGILDFVNYNDVITFTGSASTAAKLKNNTNIINNNIRFNVEADSLNCSILGPDADSNSKEFELFIKEVTKEMVVKSGQKCTAIRRIIVPDLFQESVEKALIKSLDKVVVGDPSLKEVKMGSLVGREQLLEVNEKVEKLKTECDLVYQKELELIGINHDKGAFMPCTVFRNKTPFKSEYVHDTEIFGPVSTIIPYSNTEEAVELANKGRGSLVGSVVSYDKGFIKNIILGIGAQHGRVYILDRDCYKEATGHGSPLPHLVHGGPGRSGGGEEMGGIRGVKHYMQRIALQGSPSSLTKVMEVYLSGAKQKISEKHPFEVHYDDLIIGQTLVTHKRTVTETDIVNFSNVSGDNFYAHTDITSLEGSIFKSRVAHGYFVLSAAAGLFVNPKKGPVIANYGIDFCRFLLPVYVNDTIWVKLICKQKTDKEVKNGDQPCGIVKWLVEVYNQKQEIVAIAEILTLVAKKGETFIEFTQKEVSSILNNFFDNTKPLWGKMAPQQMVEHLYKGVDCSCGNDADIKIITPKDRVIVLQNSLFNNVAMPKNYQHPNHKDQPLEVYCSSLEEAKQKLIKKVADFYDYYEQNIEAKHKHAIFGELDFAHWKHVHKKHFTHHFRQFGLI